MTAFPNTHPAIRFQHSRFKLNRTVSAVMSGGGRFNHTQIGDPFWSIEFTTVPLKEGELAALEAWWLSLRDGLRSTLVTQNVTCRPFAHSNPANAAPAQDTGTLSSVTSGNILNIASLASGLSLRAGDLLGLEVGAFRGLHRVVAVTGTGTTRAVTVEPPPRPYVATAGALVRFESPELVMRPVPGGWTLNGLGRPQVTFQMVEAPR